MFREEKVIFSCANYVTAKLGREFTEPAPWTLDDVFPDTSSSTPIIFILSSGALPADASCDCGLQRTLAHCCMLPS